MGDGAGEPEKTAGSQGDDPDPLSVLPNQFSARIEGLRELLEVISPHVAVLDRPEGIEGAIEKSGLSTEGKEAVKSLLMPQSAQEDRADAADLPEAREGASNEDPDTEETPVIDATVSRLSKVVRNEPSNFVKVMRRFSQATIAPRTSLLHGSLLTVAVASFEFLLAGLYTQHLTLFPKQLRDDEKEFSLADLSEIGSISEARRVLVERRVDAFMRRGIDDWSGWADRVLGSSFEDLCLDFNHLNEVFQRRHLVVHSEGIVSRLYLERVELSNDKPKLGEHLPVSAEYMQQALDELEVLGYGLAAVARAKWKAEDADAASMFINSRIYDMLKIGRHDLARQLSIVGSDLSQSDANRWRVVVNGWIASKNLGAFKECQKEVEDWDVSALANDFKLARACLLDEEDDVFSLLSITIQESKLKPGEVWDWPLLDDFRSDPRFEKTFLDVGYTPPRRQLSKASMSGATKESDSPPPAGDGDSPPTQQ
jgi:hypothetical protein